MTGHQCNTGVDNPSFHGNLSRTVGNSRKGFTKLDASHPEHPYIHKKIFPGNQSQLWESYLNLYKNMCWVFGKLPSLFETKPKVSYKQTKTISKFTRKSLPLLLLLWFQADTWAQRVIEGKVTIKATILCQKNKTWTLQGLKTNALFLDIDQIQIVDLHGTGQHTVLTKFYIFWMGCWYVLGESLYKFINLYSESNMKISAWALFERKQSRTASSWFWILKIIHNFREA